MKLNRRKFLQHSSLLTTGALSLNLMPTQLMAQHLSFKSNSLPYSSLQSHVLNRTSFGINQESMAKFEELGYRDFIEYQLDADAIDDSEIEDYIAQALPTVNMSLVQIRDMVESEQINQFQAAHELKAATFLRAVYSKKQLLQVMVEFWNNHFSVFHFDGPISFLKTKEDREVMRPFALSSFSEILHADAKSTAMIYYLDSYASTKEAPNENYGRELMELHTLGVDGPYTHLDIDEIARCFTGWGINQATGAFRYFQDRHDDEEKIFLGQTIPAGGGVTDGEQVVEILAANDSTAAFISKKLCQHFISDTPDPSIVESTTSKFIESNGDIKTCLRHILLSKHFIVAQDQKLKRPFHFMASAVRSLSGDIFSDDFYRSTRFVLQALGNQPFDWTTPDGYPDKADHWQSTTGMLYRWGFVNTFSFDEFRGYSYDLNTLISEPHTPENIYQQIVEKIIFRPMNSADKTILMDYLEMGASNNTVSTLTLQGALAIALGSPYFQLS